MSLPTRASVLVVALSLTPVARADGTASRLWGERGERWSAGSRLPDFSRAGYHGGDRALPDVPVVTDVRAHGARGDGATDDTESFRNAIAAAAGRGAVLVPAGRYVLREPLTIELSGVVLRGEGPGRTVLVIPRSLQDVRPLDLREGKHPYSFRGGFVVVKGATRGGKLADVTAPADRGQTVLTLSRPVSPTPGDRVRLLMNNAPSLGRYLHGDLADAGEATPKEYAHYVDLAARVVAVDGARVTVDPPLRTDVRAEWRPELWSFRPTVEEVGVERLSFEFPGVPKKPHLQEEGFNAIHLVNAVNCWVRDVTVADADLGVKLDGSRWCTVSGVTFEARRRTSDVTGHHALWVSTRSQDNLFADFTIATRFVHDLSVEGFSHGNVFARGRGVALNLDHHSNGPYANLFTGLETVDVSRLWQCGGRADRGPNAAGWNTVWGLRYESGTLPGVPGWPLLNVVGLRGTAASTPSGSGPWVEPCGGEVSPADLHDAQVRRRQRSAK